MYPNMACLSTVTLKNIHLHMQHCPMVLVKCYMLTYRLRDKRFSVATITTSFDCCLNGPLSELVKVMPDHQSKLPDQDFYSQDHWMSVPAPNLQHQITEGYFSNLKLLVWCYILDQRFSLQLQYKVFGQLTLYDNTDLELLPCDCWQRKFVCWKTGAWNMSVVETTPSMLCTHPTYWKQHIQCPVS